MKKPSSINKAIKKLKSVLKDENCDRINRSTIIGYIGELCVIKNFLKSKTKYKHKGNQSGYDICVFNGKKDLKIEVKSSSLKNEYKKDDTKNLYWGWALLRKERKIKYDYVICVAFDKKFNPVKFHIIPKDKISLFPSGVGQFKGIEHAFIIYKEEKPIIPKNWNEVYEKGNKCVADSKIILSIDSKASIHKHLTSI